MSANISPPFPSTTSSTTITKQSQLLRRKQPESKHECYSNSQKSQAHPGIYCIHHYIITQSPHHHHHHPLFKRTGIRRANICLSNLSYTSFSYSLPAHHKPASSGREMRNRALGSVRFVSRFAGSCSAEWTASWATYLGLVSRV